MEDSNCRPGEGGGRTSISLPSALRPARVSISNGNSHQTQDNSSEGKTDDVFSSAQAFDTVSPDGSAITLQSFPLSATKRLYSTNNARSPTRGSMSTASGNRASIGAGASPLYESKTSPSRRNGGGGLPSILPSSAFLTPRKPSHTPRCSQTNSATYTSPTSAASSTGALANPREGNKITSPGDGLLFSEQQLQPSLFLAGSHTSNATEREATTSAGLASSRGITSLNGSGSVSTHDHTKTSLAEGSNTGTVRSSFNTARARSDSRQDTLRSKTSREPLIIGNTTSIANEGRIDPSGRSRRKNSKTGSITTLLGLRTHSAGSSTPRARQESATSLQNPMPTLKEGHEKTQTSPGRADTSRRHSTRGEQANDEERAYRGETPHTVVPILSNKTNKPMRNYQIYREMQRQHKQVSMTNSNEGGNKEKLGNPALAYGSTDYGGNNRFLLGGRLVTSGDSPFPFIASFLLSLVLPGAFFAFEGQWLWDTSPSGIGTSGGKAIIFLFLYAALIMWTSLLRTALRDPGIIAKGLDKEPDWESIAVPVGGNDDLTGTGMGQRPKLRHFKVRDEWVSSKWCETCQTYRPPRASHCRLCDVCTEQTDHHCSFLNNCIGRRNYSSFIAFLISTIVCSAFTLGVSAAHMARSAFNDESFFDNWKNIGSIALLVITTAVTIPILGLLAYHCRLIWLSRTTIEILRPRYPSSNGKGKAANPYAYSRRIDNIIYNLCKPMDLYSTIQPHAVAEKDARQENPAFA